jgi:2-keto-4-pentenoate hydratase/2-oxohepta-3-ene-1,7-dioic acid hydratase in catechol pathway
MILLTFQTSHGLQLGVKTEKGIIDVKLAHQELHDSETENALPTTPNELFSEGIPALERLHEYVSTAIEGRDKAPWILEESTLSYGPCVPNPGKILCVGQNYRRHAIESGLAIPETPLLFSKFNNALAAPDEDIPLPKGALENDYEAELVVVIGKRGKQIPVSKALDYVMGYCNGNDLSARDLQMLTSQWLLGKSLDKFMPIGPYLATKDEVPDPQNLSVKCWLNGDLRQDSSTADMIFSIQEIISYASNYMTLEPGDIITTGTPEGVIYGMQERVWLKPGDEVVVQIDNLGKLRNKMVKGE